MKEKRPVQYDLFGHPIEERPRVEQSIMPLEFGGRKVRVVMKNGEPWWVAKDVCDVLAITNASEAVKGRADRPGDGLDEDEFRIDIVYTSTGVARQMLCVSEPGLFALIHKSNKPEARAFRRWVFHEVLPAIRKHGYYSVTTDRVIREQKRLKSDRETAVARLKVKDANKAIATRKGATVNDVVAAHNAVYKGQFGRTAKELRGPLQIKPHATPLDRMSEVCLSANLHAKALAARICRDRNVPVGQQAEVYERIAKELKEQAVGNLGSGAMLGVVDDPQRGWVLDVVQPALPALPDWTDED